MTIGSV